MVGLKCISSFLLYFPAIGRRSWYWHISTLACTCHLSDFPVVSNVFTFLTVTCFNGASSLPCALGGRSAEIRHPFIQHAFGRLGGFGSARFIESDAVKVLIHLPDLSKSKKLEVLKRKSEVESIYFIYLFMPLLKQYTHLWFRKKAPNKILL